MTPTSRSLALLRRWRFRADVAERWLEIPDPETGGMRKIRKDLFGGFDLVEVNVQAKETWLIQTTSLGNLSSRVKKLRGLSVVGDLIRGGIVCEAWGWGQREAGGKWFVRRVRIQADSLEPVKVTPKRKRIKRMQAGSLFD